MPEAHVITALVDKRARIKGEIRSQHIKLMKLKHDLAQVDSVIRMFKAELDPETIAPKVTLGKNPVGIPKGTGSRDALDILRECGQPMTAHEIALAVLNRFGADYDDQAIKMLANTIHSTLYRNKTGEVRFDRTTYPGKWEIAS
jgi:hypothetical protein